MHSSKKMGTVDFSFKKMRTVDFSTKTGTMVFIFILSFHASLGNDVVCEPSTSSNTTQVSASSPVYAAPIEREHVAESPGYLPTGREQVAQSPASPDKRSANNGGNKTQPGPNIPKLPIIPPKPRPGDLPLPHPDQKPNPNGHTSAASPPLSSAYMLSSPPAYSPAEVFSPPPASEDEAITQILLSPPPAAVNEKGIVPAAGPEDTSPPITAPSQVSSENFTALSPQASKGASNLKIPAKVLIGGLISCWKCSKHHNHTKAKGISGVSVVMACPSSSLSTVSDHHGRFRFEFRHTMPGGFNESCGVNVVNGTLPSTCNMPISDGIFRHTVTLESSTRHRVIYYVPRFSYRPERCT